MKSDEQILAGMPEFLSIEMMLKATPAQEGNQRFIYLEASREARDLQNDVVLAKALEDSADHYLKFGNIDIDHKSMPAVAKIHGIDRPDLWEIGAPVDVRVSGASTFVKAQLYTGHTDLAENANMVWDSMTKLNPPRKWYPSVGGKILAKSVRLDDKTGAKYGVVSSVRWNNVAISQQPVNQHVGGIKTIPFDVLAKSWSAGGLDITKALEASYATDAAGKTGGGAFGMQSFDAGAPRSYYDFRERISRDVKSGAVKTSSVENLTDFSSRQYSLTSEEAGEWVHRFLGELQTKLSKIKRSKSE